MKMKGSRTDKVMLCIIMFFIVLASGCATVRVQAPAERAVHPQLGALQHHQHRSHGISVQFTREF